jgi:hypothetical protein
VRVSLTVKTKMAKLASLGEDELFDSSDIADRHSAPGPERKLPTLALGTLRLSEQDRNCCNAAMSRSPRWMQRIFVTAF